MGNHNQIVLAQNSEAPVTTLVNSRTLDLLNIMPKLDLDTYKDVVVRKITVVDKVKYNVQSTPTFTQDNAVILKPIKLHDNKLCGISSIVKHIQSNPICIAKVDLEYITGKVELGNTTSINSTILVDYSFPVELQPDQDSQYPLRNSSDTAADCGTIHQPQV